MPYDSTIFGKDSAKLDYFIFDLILYHQLKANVNFKVGQIS